MINGVKYYALKITFDLFFQTAVNQSRLTYSRHYRRCIRKIPFERVKRALSICYRNAVSTAKYENITYNVYFTYLLKNRRIKLFLQAVIPKNSLIDRSINRSSNNNPDSTIEYDFIKFEL